MGFWTYDTTDKIDYLFNKNHLVVILFSLVIIIFFSMYFCRKSLKAQRISILVFFLLAVVLQVIRILWQYEYLQYIGEITTFLNVVEPTFFLLSFVISIPIIFSAILRKKTEDSKTFGLSFVYNIATLNGIISFIYPSFLNGNFEIYHFCNLSNVLIRCFVISIGLIVALSNWISLKQYLDLYRALFSLLFFGIICAILGFVVKENNLFYYEYCPIFETLGLTINFPFQYLVLGIFMFVFQCIMYLPWQIKRKREE